jgi:hypothetical protein
MAKADLSDKPAMPAEPKEFPLSLQEFCIRISTEFKQPEMIGAFEHYERVSGRLRDTETAYRSRFADFLHKPA